MSQIDDKYNQLKSHGLDLGAPKGPEKDAGSGGRVREYANGNVYYHPNTGAHEVHGGILSLYLANGGPGANPATGNRDLGYPTSDEIPGESPTSTFEWGAIYWVRGTGGCVLYGSIYATYQNQPSVGTPITSVTKVAGGIAAYFARGVIFSANGAGGIHHVLVGSLSPPKMGLPLMVDPSVEETRRLRSLLTFHLVPTADYNALIAWRPSVFTDLWQERLSLTAVGAPNAHVPLISFQSHNDASVGQVDVHVYMEAFPNGPVDLKDRTLYNLTFALPNGNSYVLSPHCVYVKKGWENFGLLHATDIHINAKNEGFRAKLLALGLPDAAAHYSNYQDNFRDFVKYANRLHALGLADVVWATGDLIDYVHEDGDAKDNFVRLRNLILGQPLDDGMAGCDELTLPIFTSFGNHDYRVFSYQLRSNVDTVGSSYDSAIDEFADHGLLESDAIALQGGKTPSYGALDLGEALKMLQYDRFDHAYDYYKANFNDPRSFSVALGKHRLVMLDTKMDDGVPAQIDLDFFIKLITGGLDPETQRIIKTNSANLVGLFPNDLSILRNAVVEAGGDGLVIVGIHGPALAQSGEYPFTMRETVHPTVPAATIAEFVKRHKYNGATWPTGTPYFKFGDLTDGLDDGGFNAGALDFLKICAGVGVPRPVDLVLCGHKHDWVEHRIKWNAGANRLEFYQDFYTENPTVYYSTVNGTANTNLPVKARVQVNVVPGATLPAGVAAVRDHRGPVEIDYGKVNVPPYADPLISSKDPKGWWQAHRPIHAMTSALGPIEHRQRAGTFYKITPPDFGARPVIESDTGPHLHDGQKAEIVAPPFMDPTFQGFRLIQVGANVIQRMHYITLAELRKNGFKMPWEPRIGRPGEVLTGGIGGLETMIG